jgi:hypothetical protein
MSEEIIEPTPEAEIVDEVVEETVEEVEVKPEETVIKLEEKTASGPGMAVVPGGAIGSTVIPGKPKKVVEKLGKDESLEKVALYSSKTVNWQGVGEVKRGYNIVTKRQADLWLKRGHIRLATPEELAKELDK